MEIKGKYTTAIVHTDHVEPEAIEQIQKIVDCQAFEGQSVHYMPDVHAGTNCTVGFTATLGEYINPSHLGGDLGCTVSMMMIDKCIPVDKYADFEHKVRNAVPMGSELNDETIFIKKEFMSFLSREFNKMRQQWPERLSDLPTQVTEKWIMQQLERLNMNVSIFYHGIGTLGGGNHFIEYNESEDKRHAGITVHCGSRNFGQKVCNYWTSVAARPKKASKDDKERIKSLKAQFKEEWKRTHWKDKTGYDEALKDFLDVQLTDASQISGYLTGEQMNRYLCDLCFAQLYARYNHITIFREIADILRKYDIGICGTIYCTHNYISPSDRMMRKGAISAKEGENILVPFNMRDGVAVCKGKGNQDWNCSCSHGSGRKMSRAQARKNISMDDYAVTMQNVYSTSVNHSTIDESPQAYKDTDEIKSLIADTCDVLYVMPSKINIKAGSE